MKKRNKYTVFIVNATHERVVEFGRGRSQLMARHPRNHVLRSVVHRRIIGFSARMILFSFLYRGLLLAARGRSIVRYGLASYRDNGSGDRISGSGVRPRLQYRLRHVPFGSVRDRRRSRGLFPRFGSRRRPRAAIVVVLKYVQHVRRHDTPAKLVRATDGRAQVRVQVLLVQLVLTATDAHRRAAPRVRDGAPVVVDHPLAVLVRHAVQRHVSRDGGFAR